MSTYKRKFFQALIADGRPLLMLTGLSLCLAGGFALFLSATGSFLPHDVSFLGMNADALCGIDKGRIVHFMFHDRVSFGGALIAIGMLYMWLVEFPLRDGEAWAWWLFLLSGITGFGSFLAYLGYGYLDTWHGVATLFLLPCQFIGIYLTFQTLRGDKGWRTLLSPSFLVQSRSSESIGRFCLAAVAFGMIFAVLQ